VLAVGAAVVASAVVSLAPTARAVCGYDPNDPPLTIKQMILSGATGSPAYDALFLGRVRRIRDPGSEGGDVTVRMRVREPPFGGDREWVRIADTVDPPGSSSSLAYDFKRGHLYAIVARHRNDGRFQHDAPCGGTTRLRQERFRHLVHLSRHAAP